MPEKLDHRGYLLAPLVPPTLNILFVPVWSVLSGHSGLAFSAMVWQVVAWFGLEAICLASIYPILWLFHRRILSLPINPSLAVALSITFSAGSSFALFGPIQWQGHVAISWAFAAIASVFAFSAFHSMQKHRRNNLAKQNAITSTHTPP
ncbi:hypothetical protein [Aquabacterium sp.]|uniref:hypothetical protein n=1 Tax=Aquabacterium sp. TaxID=1872578 RepID=UPI00248A0DDA|nr:hypothetical protein [Aquabacterium sp.]MDI1260219.1 hypothetical protein [Aquabacterium sp.]